VPARHEEDGPSALAIGLAAQWNAVFRPDPHLRPRDRRQRDASREEKAGKGSAAGQSHAFPYLASVAICNRGR
jgi:hypothetical protein